MATWNPDDLPGTPPPTIDLDADIRFTLGMVRKVLNIWADTGLAAQDTLSALTAAADQIERTAARINS